MPLSASTIWEVETGGSDSANAGAFDPSQTAGMFTDGAATLANTSAPVFTSASYNFGSNDIGAWIYIASGTHWTAGWYKITAVGSNKATLNGTIGQAVLKTTLVPSTVLGCTSDNTASPTTATWTIDYSQGANSGAGPAYTFSHLTSVGTGLTVSGGTLGDHTFGKQDVGNCLVITGGTNFNLGRYVITSVAAGVATVVGPTNITTGAGATGTGALGGALASPGQAYGVFVGTNVIFVKTGVYSLTTTSTNVSGGVISSSGASRLEGYGTIRGDLTSPPTLQASGISTTTLVSLTGNTQVTRNIIFDGASLTAIRGLAVGIAVTYKCGFINCTNQGYNQNNSGFAILCYATGCTTTSPTMAGAAGTTVFLNCEAYSNSGLTGFSNGIHISCLSYNNGGDGFNPGARDVTINCVAYLNSGKGFNMQASVNLLINCIAEANASNSYNNNGALNWTVLINCAAYGNGTDAPSLGSGLQLNNAGFITGSSSFFVNPGSGNFALNMSPTGGALLRNLGFPATFPAATTANYIDIGAAQANDFKIPMNIAGLI